MGSRLYVYVPATDSINALIIVVKETWSGALNDDQIEDDGDKVNGRFDDPVESDEDGRAD